jgi:hypothetical protein
MKMNKQKSQIIAGVCFKRVEPLRRFATFARVNAPVSTEMKHTLIAVAVFLIVVMGCSTPVALQPTNTPQPTATPIPGWEKLTGKDIEIWLPESYEGGDPSSEDIDTIFEKAKALGPNFEQMAQAIKNNPSMFVFWAFDSNIGESGAMTNVGIATERVLSSMTLDTYMEVMIKQLPNQIQVVNQEKITLDDYDEARRMMMEITVSNIIAKQVMYVLREGNKVWLINFTTGKSEFDQRLTTFEQAVNTFKIIP